MIFNKIRLKNFKSHEDTTINFEPAINFIIGDNGAGKSTILEAISFALFKQHTTKKISDLVKINKNQNTKNQMEVSLDFNVNGKIYRIIRKIIKTQNNEKTTIKSEVKLFISNDGEFYPLVTGDKQVASEIQLLLNMDSELFLNAIYIRQGEIAELVSKTPSEKKKLIAKLLKIDSFEKAWNNMLPLINIYQNRKYELKGKVSSIEDLKDSRNIKELTLRDLNKDSKIYQEKLESSQKNRNNLAIEKEAIESKKSTFETLNNNLVTGKENFKKTLNDKITFEKQLESIEKMEKEISSISPDVEKLPNFVEFFESIKKIKNLKKDEEFLKNKLSSIKDCKEILETEKPQYFEHQDIEKGLSKLNDEKQKYENELQILDKISQDKKNLELEISKDKESINNLFENINKSLNTNYDDFKSFDNHIKGLYSEIENKMNDIDEKISSNSQKNSASKEAINSAQKHLNEIEKSSNECPVCKSDITTEKKENLLNLYNDTIDENQKSIKSNDIDIKRLKTEKDVFKSKLNDFDKFSTDISVNEYVFEKIQNDNNKINEFEDKLKIVKEKKLKLAEIISSIDSLIKRKEITNNSYNNYIKSQGSLDSLGNESTTKNELDEIIKLVDLEVEKIKNIMETNPDLSTDLDEDIIKEKIDFLKSQDKKYNQLKGSVSQKDNITSQLIVKEKDLNWRRDQIKKLEEDIESCNYDEEIHKKIIYEFNELDKNIIDINKNIFGIKGKATEIINSIKELNKRIDETIKYEKELSNINDFLKLLIEIRELYSKNGIQKDLRSKSRPLIQKNTLNFFEKFNFNYSDLRIDEDYNVFVFGPEGETNLDMVSGGEKIAIALALRLGITQSLSSSDLEAILLDEPTIHLDSYRRNELIGLLMNMSIIPQMIIVTHDTELENAADNIIKIKKENGVSKIEIE